MGAYLRGGRWWWYKRMLDGRTYYRPLRVRKGQESLLSARIAQEDEAIVASHYGLAKPPASSVPFSEFVRRYLKAKKDKKTIDRDRQRLEYIASLWPDLPLGFYGKQHVETLEKKLAASGPLGRVPKPATLNRYMELLRSLFNLAIEDRIIRENPVRFYESWAEEGTRRALSDDELRAVLAAAEKLGQAKSFKLRHVFRDLIIFGLATGMRLSEILNLRR
jgi:integrase